MHPASNTPDPYAAAAAHALGHALPLAHKALVDAQSALTAARTALLFPVACAVAESRKEIMVNQTVTALRQELEHARTRADILAMECNRFGAAETTLREGRATLELERATLEVERAALKKTTAALEADRKRLTQDQGKLAAEMRLVPGSRRSTRADSKKRTVSTVVRRSSRHEGALESAYGNVEAEASPRKRARTTRTSTRGGA
ncbi:hypothetical protein C8R44DRAFT_881369 [Mycena epipterygia]|nr:hypothetical protein C8R44DRAFT_881369 [Mycena epipterygia]